MMLKRVVYGEAMKKFCLYILLTNIVLLLGACSIQKDRESKLRDVDFTVVSYGDVPEELQAKIEDGKKEAFQMTYGDKGYLYAARGYGRKDTSGYSIEVTECCETTNTIRVSTDLLGPVKGEEVLKKSTCPYVVIKMEYSDKNVVFN